MSSQDYRINAEVRRFLVSRWVDVSLLQIGTTNGVVYLMGSFEPLVEDALQRVGLVQEGDPARRVLRLLLLVEKEMRRLHGVRDVVFNLRNVRRKSGSWGVKGPQGQVFLDVGKKKQHGTEEETQIAQAQGEAQDEASDDERTDTPSGTR